MGYVGNQTTTAFTSMDKQDITGDGTPNYTLSHAVANANEIEVFVNNVRQEPTVAYSASGTTLTMTGNVASSDDFYVVYQGKAVGTIVPPDGSVTNAKIADDAVTSAKLDTNIAVAGNLTVDTDTLYVDSTNNRVGIGTTSPSGKLNLATGASTACELRLTSNNTGAGAGDRGRIAVYSSRNDGTAYEAGKIEIDRSSGTADEARMTFATNGGSGNTERMRIDSNGNLLVGTTTASGQITSESNGTKFQYASHNTDASGVSQLSFRFMRNTADVGSITTTASATAYNTLSDYRLKEAVTDMTGATDRLKQLNPVRFNFIADADTTVDGFLAHEVQAVVPEAVTGTHNEVDDDGNAVMQGIDQSKLVPLLVATIQEQQAAIEALTARVTALEAN